MAKLKVTLKESYNRKGEHSYYNEVNSNNFKEVALVLSDLTNHGVPVKKAIIEYFKLIKTDWEAIIGV
jgi:hypothetical protein